MVTDLAMLRDRRWAPTAGMGYRTCFRLPSERKTLVIVIVTQFLVLMK
jgi:hypothetical protein